MNEPDGRDTPLLQILREGTDPGLRPEARRAAFVDATAERAARGRRSSRARWIALAALASGAAAVLLAIVLEPGEGDPPPGAASVAAYAYFETDLLAEEAGSDVDAWLTEDQAALAAAFDLP